MCLKAPGRTLHDQPRWLDASTEKHDSHVAVGAADRRAAGQSDFIAASIALRSDVLSALNALRDAAA
jgi:hypothetical protein